MTAEEAEETQGREQPANPSLTSSAEEELKFVSPEVRERCEKMGVYPLGLPTQMQLVLEIRELASRLQRNPGDGLSPVSTGKMWLPGPDIDQAALDGISARSRISTGLRVHFDHSLPGECPVCLADSLAISDRDALLGMIRQLRGE